MGVFGSAGLKQRVWPRFREFISLANVPLCHCNTLLSWPVSRSIQSSPITTQHLWFMQASEEERITTFCYQEHWIDYAYSVDWIKGNKPPKPPFHAEEEEFAPCEEACVWQREPLQVQVQVFEAVAPQGFSFALSWQRISHSQYLFFPLTSFSSSFLSYLHSPSCLHLYSDSVFYYFFKATLLYPAWHSFTLHLV